MHACDAITQGLVVLAITSVLGASFAGQAFQLLAPLALGIFPGALVCGKRVFIASVWKRVWVKA